MIYLPLLEENDVSRSDSSPSSRSPRPRASGYWRKKFFFLLGFGLVSTFFIGLYCNVSTWKVSSHATNLLDDLAYMLRLHKHVHAVIIDAGSTGSRVLAFSFHEPIFGEKNLKLHGELFYQIKPGLSSFADNPEKGAEHLQILLEKAKSVIPREAWAETPLSMKATAGLRLLPKEKAEALLREVSKLFANSPFHTTASSVGIMDGVDEGLFSWFTVNFLQDRLGGDVENTAAALDLGGGSTQITFAPSSEATLKASDPEYLYHISAFHQNITVYTHSYLGLGLMAARKEILSVGNPADATELHSECINPIIKTEWAYGGKTYKVLGSKNPLYLEIKGNANRIPEKKPVVRFEECAKIIRNYVSNKVDKPKELNKKEINAFSYYFDRATEYGLIDPFKGGVVKIKQFHDAAVATCATPNTEQPFMCLDLTFISVLLQDGFGLNPQTSLNLFKKIDGHEISWALGAAFHILQNGL
ncbi:hypothetical protein R5R35_009685 [Gryllus longicercus]|uniref:Ectonucleoside triphosphate diphosphohydrolase 5 n=1 Tax=Gryllus longicercus TaxID=2509291 RepID=A0AAN9VED7_9ORTH